MIDPSPPNLGVSFRQYFQIDYAATDTMLRDVFRIRHEVYCEDLKFEEVRENRQEIDDYDSHSAHCLMRTSKEPRQLVGCARLTMVNPTDPLAPLAFEKICQGGLDLSVVDPKAMDRQKIAEVSRLAVLRQFRNRRGEAKDAAGVIRAEDFGVEEQARFPHIQVGLYLGVMAMANFHKIDTMFMLTEPRLAAHFKNLGMNIIQIGSPVEHRGTRIPSMLNVDDAILGLKPAILPLWETIRNGIVGTEPRVR